MRVCGLRTEALAAPKLWYESVRSGTEGFPAMPYFFVLPAFVVYVLAMGLAIAVASVYQPLRHLRGYIVSVLGWSSLGFVVATIVYAVILVFTMAAVDRFVPGMRSMIGGIALAVVIFIGPFVAAVAGLLGGAFVAIRRLASPGRVIERI